MVRRWDLAMVEKEMACASLCVGSMRDCIIYARLGCLCEIMLSRGAPLVALYMQPVRVYKYFRLVLQVEVLGLVGFLYHSSGLLPW
jgi:hypothetical protein